MTPITTASRTISAPTTQDFRDDRLASLAVLAYLPGAGRYVALTRAARPRTTRRSAPRTGSRATSSRPPTSGRSGLAPAPGGRAGRRCARATRSARSAASASTPRATAGRPTCRTGPAQCDRGVLPAPHRHRRRPDGRHLGHHAASDGRARHPPQPTAFTLEEALEHRHAPDPAVLPRVDGGREPEGSRPATSCTSRPARAGPTARCWSTGSPAPRRCSPTRSIQLRPRHGRALWIRAGAARDRLLRPRMPARRTASRTASTTPTARTSCTGSRASCCRSSTPRTPSRYGATSAPR